MRTCLPLVTILAILAAAEVFAADEPIAVVRLDRREPVLYERDIEPIFADKCYACHSGTFREGRYDMSDYDRLIKGGRRGPAIVPGKASESLLVRLAGRTGGPVMPPKDEEPLTPQELALIKLWIDQGTQRGPATTETVRPKSVPAPLSPKVQIVRAVAVSPDGTLVVAGRSNRLHLFDVTTGGHQRELVDPQLSSPGGKPPATAHLDLIEALAFSLDGTTIASGSFQEVILWNATSGVLRQRVTGFSDRVLSLAFSPDGKYLAVGGGPPAVAGEVRIVDTATGNVIADLTEAHSDSVTGVCFSPDGSRLVSCSSDRTIKVFEVPRGRLLRTFEGHTSHVLDVSWSGDGRLIASTGTDGVKLWNYEADEQLRCSRRGKTGIRHKKPVNRLRFVNGYLLTCSGDQTVGVWNPPPDDLESVSAVSTYRTTEYLSALGASADGLVVAAGGDQGGIWLFTGERKSDTRRLMPLTSSGGRQ